MNKYINPFNLFVGAFIPNWLLARDEVSAGAKLCYARLAQFAGKDGECYPSQITLATEIGAGERQIRRYINELEEQRLIDSVQVGLNQTNRYRFLWHPWMEVKTAKKQSKKRGKGGKGEDHPDRTYMATPDRTNESYQERPDTSAKENQLRESYKTTTSVVVDEEKIKKVKMALAPIYSHIPDTVIASLIQKKGLDQVISIADQTAYQFNHRSNIPENPTGHFIALTLQGMHKPQGYQSPDEIAQSKKAMRMRSECRRKETERAREDLIPREDIQNFLKHLLSRGNEEVKSGL